MHVQGFVLDLFQQRLAPSYHGFCHCFNNGLPRSIGHGRRLANRQAFSLGVIDLISVCVKEHLTDCGIIVIHVLGEPLLGHGLCEGLDLSLREEVVLGLITCVGEGLVSRPPCPWRECKGDLLLNLGEVEG